MKRSVADCLYRQRLLGESARLVARTVIALVVAATLLTPSAVTAQAAAPGTAAVL